MRSIVIGGCLLAAVITAGRAMAQEKPRAGALPTRGSPADPLPPCLVLGVDLSWGYRMFREAASSGADKRYDASGIFGFGVRAELYPFAGYRTVFWRRLGVDLKYARAVGLRSRDVDTGQNIGTQWYQIAGGIQLRLLDVERSQPVALRLRLGFERSVFDFASAPPSPRPVPTGRYSLAFAGFDGRVTLHRFALLTGVQALYPLAKAPLGNLTPEGGGLGLRAQAGVGFALNERFGLDAVADYTVVSFALAPVPGLSDGPGLVHDRYLVFNVGATVAF